MLQVTRFGPVLRLRLARRLPGLRPLWVHAFLVDGLLIDAGLPHSVPELLQALAGERVEQVLLTHHHEDHVGAAAALQRRALKPLIHPAGIPLLAARRRLPWFERVYWGTPAPVAAAPLAGTVATGHYRFTVLHTPGHAPDHVVLHEPTQGWLFSGDLIINPRLATAGVRDDLRLWQESLRQAAGLPAEQVFCSHYPKVAGTELLRQKLDFLGETAARARDLQRQGLPLQAISDRVLGREDLAAVITGGLFTRRNLIRALLAAEAGAEGP